MDSSCLGRILDPKNTLNPVCRHLFSSVIISCVILPFARSIFSTLCRNILFDGIINIAGVDDPTGLRFGDMSSISERELLSSLPSDRFTLFLKHQPHIDEGSLGLYDLQLSGHTHKGQIFPFNFYVKFFFPFINGLHEITDVSSIYISRGTGTWGPPVRFLSPPEVTVFELVNVIDCASGNSVEEMFCCHSCMLFSRNPEAFCNDKEI